MNKNDVKKLFEDADAAQAAMDKAQGALDVAQEQRSNAIKRIADEVGTGPFEWKGKTLQIRKRDSKDAETKEVTGTNWFFVNMAGEVQRIG